MHGSLLKAQAYKSSVSARRGTPSGCWSGDTGQQTGSAGSGLAGGEEESERAQRRGGEAVSATRSNALRHQAGDLPCNVPSTVVVALNDVNVSMASEFSTALMLSWTVP